MDTTLGSVLKTKGVGITGVRQKVWVSSGREDGEAINIGNAASSILSWERIRQGGEMADFSAKHFG